MGLWDRLTGTRPSLGPQVLIIGLDGAPWSLLRRFIADGTMPHLGRIVQEGSFAPMETSIPDISSVAWTGFFTGMNPGRHRIYGFIDLKPKSYDLEFPNALHVRAPAMWNSLDAARKRSIVVNVPSTYPAQPLNGMLISGFVAIDLAKATYPQSFVPDLQRAGYQLDVDATTAKMSLEAFAKELIKSLDAREAVIWRLLTEQTWDLFIGVITETDRMHHYLWAALEDPAHPQHRFFLDFYRRVDAWVGKVCDWYRGKGLFMLMSDHGFCGIKTEVYLNWWLRSEGYLSFSVDPPTSHNDISPATRAFALDPARIYIHTKDRFPRGSVASTDEYERLRRELREKLSALTIDGAKVVKRVFLKEELYHGAELAGAPDLVLLPEWGYDIKGALHRPALTGKTLLTGMHTQDDSTFFINVPGITKHPIHITDIAPTALKHLGVSPIAPFDGVSLI